MTRFSTPKRGRGTGKASVSQPRTFNSRKEEEEVFKKGEREIGRSPVPRPLSDPLPSDHRSAGLAAFLAQRPAMTPRDYKGKGFGPHAPFDRTFVSPSEKPWHELNTRDVREAATSDKARFLPRSYRQAAARDEALEWDEERRCYRLRAGGEGTLKVSDAPSEGPAAVLGKNANTNFQTGSSRARARARAHDEVTK